MPPKVDVKTLAGKLDNAVKLLYELMEEFETIFSVKPELKTLEAAFSLVETKYRLVKKQQETILDRLVDEGTGPEDELVLATKKTGDKTKADFLQITLKFAAYQKEQNSSENSKVFQTFSRLFQFTEKVKCRRISLGLFSWGPHLSLERENPAKTKAREFFYSQAKFGI